MHRDFARVELPKDELKLPKFSTNVATVDVQNESEENIDMSRTFLEKVLDQSNDLESRKRVIARFLNFLRRTDSYPWYERDCQGSQEGAVGQFDAIQGGEVDCHHG